MLYPILQRARYRSELEELQAALWPEMFQDGSARCREHKYVGGPPNPRLKKMQLAHETRARKAGVVWDMVDLRVVYRNYQGICGICHEPVSLEETTFDHIVPISKRGPHILTNLQPAHLACNIQKGNR